MLREFRHGIEKYYEAQLHGALGTQAVETTADGHRYSIDQPFVTPCPDMGYVENFLNMMFNTANEDNIPNRVLVRASEELAACQHHAKATVPAFTSL